MEDRALASNSADLTCLRIETKWEESFSSASGLNLGAHRLAQKYFLLDFRAWEEGELLRGVGGTYDLQ